MLTIILSIISVTAGTAALATDSKTDLAGSPRYTNIVLKEADSNSAMKEFSVLRFMSTVLIAIDFGKGIIINERQKGNDREKNVKKEYCNDRIHYVGRDGNDCSSV